tara:strand:+ start:22 stop:345 length:324 start_codon:yes stop_codon:yes gene_type:complete
MIEIINNRIILIDDTSNMIEIDDANIIELYKSMKVMVGDVVIDKTLIEPIEDIYHYIIEKIYTMPGYAYEISFKSFDELPKEKLLIAFNKFFFDMIEKYENTGTNTD